MATKIQIKRSSTANAASISLSSGELAYSSNGELLYIGSPSGSVVAIAGQRNPGTLTANQALVVDSNKYLNQINIGAIWANGSLGNATDILASNGTAVYWKAGNSIVTYTINSYSNTSSANITLVPSSGSNSTIKFVGGNGETVSSDGSTITITAVAANGISVDSNGINVVGSYGVTSNSSATYAVGSNGIIVTSTGINVNANNGIVSNASGTFVKNGDNTLVVNAGGVYVNSSLSLTNLSLSGNLTVSGGVTTIDTTTLSVKDNMIILADQQSNSSSFTDIVDAGFYIDTGNTSVAYYSGLARIATTSTNTNPYFKLFSTNTSPNNTTIDTNANTGTLQAFLSPWGSGGAFVVNSTTVTVTANASINVSFAANTLTLSSALAATSGGTGLNTFAIGDLLLANSTTTLTRLAVDTTSGKVLQSNGTTVIYSDIDAGTF